MTGLLILAFVPLLAAAFLFIRVRQEQKLRRETELLSHALDQQIGAAAPIHPDWNAVLAHELRSPIATILGYQELVHEGTFGELSTAARDSLHRIGLAAQQLLLLVDAVEHSLHPRDTDDIETVDAAELCNHAIETVRLDAEARNVALHDQHVDLQLSTRHAPAARALVLILGAAIKASPGATLHVHTLDDTVPAIAIDGSTLDPERDTLHPDRPLTGPALRLHLARAAAQQAGGSIRIGPSGSVRLELPRLS